MSWEQRGEKISKDGVLKMYVDLKYTVKMPRADRENEQTPGFFFVVHHAFEVLFERLA